MPAILEYLSTASSMEANEVEQLLVRLDERTKRLDETTAQMRRDLHSYRIEHVPRVDLSRVETDLAALRVQISALDARFVERVEFTPVRSVVFGLVAVIMLAVIGAMTAMVIR